MWWLLTGESALTPPSATSSNTEIFVALIAAAAVVIAAVVSGPLVVSISKFRKENTEQHNNNMAVIAGIKSKIDRIDAKVDDTNVLLSDHIAWHAHNNEEK